MRSIGSWCVSTSLFLVACSATRVEPLPPAAPAGEVRIAPRSDLLRDASAARLLEAAIAVQRHRRAVALGNLANVDTCAWKRRVPLLGAQPIPGDRSSHTAPTVCGSTPVMAQGVIVATGRTLDVAIDGEGFFAVQEIDGTTGYTRNGRFLVNADSKLVTDDGRPVLPEITVPQDVLEIAIEVDGTVAVRTAGSPDVCQTLGQLQLSRFANPGGLRANGTRLAASHASGAPVTHGPGLSGLGLLRRGALEGSNVDAAAERAALRAAEHELQALQGTLAEFGVTLP